MSKYRNRKTTVNGIVFDSAAEARRYQELCLLARAGEIQNLKLQPQFTLVEGFKTPKGEAVRPMVYRADFSYSQSGQLIVEDVKGALTKEYLLKRKLVLDRFGIEIVEIKV